MIRGGLWHSRRWHLYVALIGLGTAPLLWVAIFSLLYADQGFDFSDEGLYLLAVDQVSTSTNWGYPFAWHLKWIYWLSSENLAIYRTIGAFIIVVLGGLAGLASASLGWRLLGKSPSINRNIHFGLTTFASALGGLYLYSGFLRTPGYNWVNLTGMLIAIIGLVLSLIKIMSTSATEAARRSKLYIDLGACLFGAGLFFTIPAKPSTVIFVGLIAILLVALASGVRALLRWLMHVSITMAFLIAISLPLGIWDLNWVGIFQHAFQSPKVSNEAVDVVGAIYAALLDPLTIFSRQLIDVPSWRTSLYVVGVIFLLWPYRWGVASRWLRLALFFTTIPVVVYASRISIPFAIFPPVQRWTNSWFHESSSVLGLLLLTLATGVLIYSRSAKKDDYPSVQTASLFWFGIAVCFLSSIGALDGFSKYGIDFLAIGASFSAMSVFLRKKKSDQFGEIQHFASKDKPNRKLIVYWSYFVLLLVLPIIFSFGSGNGIIYQSNLALVFLVIALFFLSTLLVDSFFGLLPVAIIFIIFFLLSVSVWNDSRKMPYRTDLLATKQTEVNLVGSQKSVFVPDQDAQFLKQVIGSASDAGWAESTPLIDLNQISPGIPYFLKARVPDSLMPQWEQSKAVSFYNLEFSKTRFPMDKAWISLGVLAGAETMQSKSRQELLSTLQDLYVVTGLNFPEDYSCALEADFYPHYFNSSGRGAWSRSAAKFQMWKPIPANKESNINQSARCLSTLSSEWRVN